MSQMKIMGFADNEENGVEIMPQDCKTDALIKVEVPVRSVVRVKFMNGGMELSYYNDKFDLEEGDVVFVDGKYEGVQGRVVKVTTHFKIDLNKYKKVVAKLNFKFHGTFSNVGPYMTCFNENTLTSSQFASWVFPPKEEQPQFVTGDGYEVDLSILDEYDFIDYQIKQRGYDIIEEGKLKFVSVIGTKGEAFIEGSNWYKLDFEYRDGVVKNLECECPYPDFCKHEFALCLFLKYIFSSETFVKSFKENKRFIAIDKFMFMDVALPQIEKIIL